MLDLGGSAWDEMLCLEEQLIRKDEELERLVSALRAAEVRGERLTSGATPPRES